MSPRQQRDDVIDRPVSVAFGYIAPDLLEVGGKECCDSGTAVRQVPDAECLVVDYGALPVTQRRSPDPRPSGLTLAAPYRRVSAA